MKASILNFLSPRIGRWVRWLAAIFVVYSIVGFLILPPIIRVVAAKQIARQLDREVFIRKVRLNPYTLSTTIRGLLVKDKNGEPFLSWDEVYVNFQLSSFFGHTWVFKEVNTSQPFVRVQMNKDYTFNFSDLITKFSAGSPAAKNPPKPLALRIDRLQITGAVASLADLTPRTPFKRTVGPIDVTLVGFRTDPSNKNPYSFTGTTDAGEKISWSGFFYLTPIRSEGEFALENLTLNKYAALYQDFVRFQIRDGTVSLRANYSFEFSSSNRVASVVNSSFKLHSFKLAEADSDSNLAELSDFAVTGANVDVIARTAEVESISGSGGNLALRRNRENAINVVELSKPAEGFSHAPGGILFLLQSVTNAVAFLLNSTNQWAGTIHDVNFTNCALSLEDLVNSRPVRLELNEISLAAKHISNVPGTNLTAALSLRWNTNGLIRTTVEASFLPPTAEIEIGLSNLELRALDPYLESKLNLFVLDSKLSLNGRVHLRTANAELPQVTFAGDAQLDDFSTVDGVLAEDLLKWKSVRVSGIDANLNPPAVAIREIAVDDAYARLVIETNRTINLLTALRMSDTNATGATGEPVTKSNSANAIASVETSPPNAPSAFAELPKISVATVVISNAQVRFTDRSIIPHVNMTIQDAGGTISGLSSEELQHADVNLHARVDNVGPVEITGAINPFRPNETNEIKVVVKNVDLTPASPYIGKFAGYRLAKGKLEMNLDYHLRERQLKSQNLIVLDQFTFGEKVNSPEATKLPVRLAIAILKDRNGKIQLDVPIEGSLDDPEFKLKKVIVHALVNVIKKIATSPFAALGAIFGGGGEELSYQDFVPGTDELSGASREKLDKLIKGLYERPELQLDIEGSVDLAADLDGLRQEALEKQIRTLKWMSLRKAEQATLTTEQVTVTPEERTEWLKKLLTDALAKGEIATTLATNQSSAGSNAAPVVSLSAARALAGVTRGSERGATALMRKSVQKETVALSHPSPATAAPAPSTPSEQMTQLLLNAIEVKDSDFQALTSARAKAVREYILQSGKVEPERVFLVESQAGGFKSQGSRAYLQLK